jgi:hypothetical protein
MKMTRIQMLFSALLSTTAVTMGATAYSQTMDPVWDSSQLPESHGTVRQYTLTPRGDVDGLILSDGTEVKLPPHLTGQVVFAIRPGDQVSIRGLRARAIPLIDAGSITNVATGKSVVDNGPPGRPDRGGYEQAYSARIASTLHGKRGEVNGALLDDGTVLRLPPPEAERLEGWLRPGPDGLRARRRSRYRARQGDRRTGNREFTGADDRTRWSTSAARTEGRP